MGIAGYLVFFLLTVILAVLSMLVVFCNPVTHLLMGIAAPIVRLLGRMPAGGWSALRPAQWLSATWPLLLSPLHWLADRQLGWSIWGYAALLLATNVLLAVALLYGFGCRP